MFDMFPVQKVQDASKLCSTHISHLAHVFETCFISLYVLNVHQTLWTDRSPKKTYLKCCQISTFETVWHKVAYTQVGQIVKDPWISLVFFLSSNVFYLLILLIYRQNNIDLQKCRWMTDARVEFTIPLAKFSSLPFLFLSFSLSHPFLFLSHSSLFSFLSSLSSLPFLVLSLHHFRKDETMGR